MDQTKISKKWWILFILGCLFSIPAISFQNYSPDKSFIIVSEVLWNPMIYSFKPLFVISKLLIIIIVFSLMIFRGYFSLIYKLLFIILFTGISIFQNIAFTTSYGFAMILGNILVQLCLVSLLIYDCIHSEVICFSNNISASNIWLIPLGVFSFLFPINEAGLPNFNPIYLLSNEGGLTFCMIFPLFMSLFMCFRISKNIILYKYISFIGLIFGIINILVWFIFSQIYLWMGVLHIPLFAISLYSFIKLDFEIRILNKKIAILH